MKKKLGILIAVIVFVLTILTGCGKQMSLSGNKEIKILFVMNESDTFRQKLADAAQQAASKDEIQMDIKDAEGSIETQVDFIKTAEADGYDAIICSPISIDTIVELKASAGNLPIVFINSCPDDKYLEAGKSIYVGSSESVAGQYQAEYLLDKLSEKSELNVVIMKGPKNHSGTVGRTNGAKKVLDASGKTIHYVFEDYANWDTEQARKLFQIFLMTGKTMDCVICNNDSMAVGVIQACKEANIDPASFPIVGVDADAGGCEAIENGDMVFSVYQSATGQGEASLQAAVHLAKGESIKDMEGATEDCKYVWVPFEKVDSSNVGNYH